MQLDVLYELCWVVRGGLGQMKTQVKRMRRAHFDKYEPWLEQALRKMCCYSKETCFAAQSRFPAHFSHKDTFKNNLQM